MALLTRLLMWCCRGWNCPFHTLRFLLSVPNFTSGLIDFPNMLLTGSLPSGDDLGWITTSSITVPPGPLRVPTNNWIRESWTPSFRTACVLISYQAYQRKLLYAIIYSDWFEDTSVNAGVSRLRAVAYWLPGLAGMKILAVFGTVFVRRVGVKRVGTPRNCLISDACCIISLSYHVTAIHPHWLDY